MPNDERSPSLEISNGEAWPLGVSLDFRISVFFCHSSFVIRIWSLSTAQVGGFRFTRTTRQIRVSRKDFRNDLAMDIGETPVGAAVAERQFPVIDAQQVQHR